MKKILAAICMLSFALSGCVLGYGHCLLTEPIKSRLTGTLHYQKFPAADGVDNVPILVLDKTAYIYSPGTSRQCQSANDVQLLPLADLPESVHENSRLEIRGRLALSANSHQHSRFTMTVITFRVIKP